MRHHRHETDEQESGHPVRHRYDADPLGALHPSARETTDVHAMTVSRGTRGMGSGDARPPVMRPGATLANTLPSRTGSVLRWPDGRVTKVDA